MTREAKALVPKLRFPEFRNAGKWKVKTLRLILNAEVSEASQNELEFVENGYSVYGASGFVGRIKTYEQDEDYIAIVKDGSGVGRLYLHEKFTSVLGTLTYLKLRDKNEHNLIWVYHLLSTLDLSKYVVGTGIPHIYFKDYSNESVPVPTLQEQCKIADCLGSLDDLITAGGKKLEALRQQKQGLMQQLFPQPGETVPKLRFPEFRDAGGWYELPLSELSEIVRGGSPRPIDAYITDATNGLNWLKIGDVSKESKYITHTDQKILPEAIKKTRVVNPGDFILSNSMSFGRPYLLKIRACIHDGWIAVTQLRSTIDENFLYYLMTSGYSQRYFEKSAAGTGVRNLTVNIIRNLPVRFPDSAEQHRIADYLSSLDDLITAEGRKLEALRQQKQGLMQQLFPSLEAK